VLIEPFWRPRMAATDRYGPESDFSNWRLSEVPATTSSQWNLKLRIEILFLENFSIKYAKYDAYSGF
jgi:hypothetical protein